MGAQFTLGRIAEALGATPEGYPARVIRRVAPVDGAGPEHVSNDVPAGEVRAGIPSRPVGETRRIWAAGTLLPDLLRRFRALEKRVRELEGGWHA